MHIYVFGSLCRGDLSLGSDVDLLAIVDEYNQGLDKEVFSIYSYNNSSDSFLTN